MNDKMAGDTKEFGSTADPNAPATDLAPESKAFKIAALMFLTVLGVMLLFFIFSIGVTVQHGMVMQMSGPQLAYEIDKSGYEVSGVIPGGTADSYRIVFSAMTSHGECAVENTVIVDCDWYSLRDTRE